MNSEFIQAIYDLEKEKGIEAEVLFEAIENALIVGFKKNFNANTNVRVSLDRETGELHVYSQRTIVEKVIDPELEISIEDAHHRSKKYELGEIFENEVTPKNFGRIAAQTAKQVIVQRIREAERDVSFTQYAGKEGEIANAVVAQPVSPVFSLYSLGCSTGVCRASVIPALSDGSINGFIIEAKTRGQTTTSGFIISI